MRKGLAHIFRFENAAAYVSALHLQPRGALFTSLLGAHFQFSKGILSVFCLGAACAGHASHPVQFFAVEVLCPGNLCIRGIHSFLPLLEVILVVALVGVERFVVKFQNMVAHVVQKVAVVRYHEHRFRCALQVTFEPFYHS